MRSTPATLAAPVVRSPGTAVKSSFEEPVRVDSLPFEGGQMERPVYMNDVAKVRARPSRVKQEAVHCGAWSGLALSAWRRR